MLERHGGGACLREASSQFLPCCTAQGVRALSSLPVSYAVVGRQWVRPSGLEVKVRGEICQAYGKLVCMCVRVCV